MGTRSLTVIRDSTPKFGKEIVVMYRQMDGYPSVHGADLAHFLNGMVVGNGISLNGPEKFANGASCLAAQIVSVFKMDSGPGGIYLYPAGTRDTGEEFIYYVDASPGEEIEITAIEVGWGDVEDKQFFKGTPEDFLIGLERGRFDENN